MNPSNSVSRAGLFLSVGLFGAYLVTFVFATAFHPSGIDPNNHPLVFVQYAHSSGWTADHLGWFVSTSLLIAAFLVLIDALNVSGRMARTASRTGMVLGATAIALTALREAVDGVVLKRAVDAWVSAPPAEQAARFASAEVARWMEEASASYQNFALGLTVLVLAGLIIWTARVPRPIGYLFALLGAAYLATGWILGESGFAPQGTAPSYATEFIPVICAAYLLVVAWRMPHTAAELSASGLTAKPEGA